MLDNDDISIVFLQASGGFQPKQAAAQHNCMATAGATGDKALGILEVTESENAGLVNVVDIGDMWFRACCQYQLAVGLGITQTVMDPFVVPVNVNDFAVVVLHNAVMGLEFERILDACKIHFAGHETGQPDTVVGLPGLVAIDNDGGVRAAFQELLDKVDTYRACTHDNDRRYRSCVAVINMLFQDG